MKANSTERKTTFTALIEAFRRLSIGAILTALVFFAAGTGAHAQQAVENLCDEPGQQRCQSTDGQSVRL